ncbi:hypothetical protein VAEU17_2440002 [Vibrio aestuarianus]|nr:hypothetical protein VAEU17_2440002 [Vibrio aestuarianus]
MILIRTSIHSIFSAYIEKVCTFLRFSFYIVAFSYHIYIHK